MMHILIAAMLLFSSQAHAQEEPTEQLKADALRLGYQLNGNSMVRWGSIDLTTIINPTYPYVRPTPELIGPPAPPKKEDKR
jgi:hypothetical protein